MRTLVLFLVTSATAFAEPVPSKQLIFPRQEKHVHGSSVVELPNGDLLAAWFYGSGERNADDVLVQGARLTKGADRWSGVFVMADTPGVPDCNPVLFLDREQQLWLFSIAVIANRWESCLLKYRRTKDYAGAGAPNWSWQDVITLKPGEQFSRRIGEGFDKLGFNQQMWAEYSRPYDWYLVEAAKDRLKRRVGWMTRGHAIQLPSGRIVLPLYSDGFNLSIVAFSDDKGESWEASSPIVGLGNIQPSLARRRNGTLVALMRDAGPAPSLIMSATSSDDGATWTVATDTDQRGSSASVQVCELASGQWVLVHNDIDNNRNRLTLSLSDDEGRTWKWRRAIEDSKNPADRFAYPSIIEGSDGRLHITYSHHTQSGKAIAHFAVHPEWIQRN